MQNTATRSKLTTVAAVVNQEGNSVAKIRKNQGEEVVKQLIAREILEVFEFYGAEIKPSQLKISCDVIASEFYYLKLHEIQFAFRNGMLGKYSKVFGKFNPSFLVEWLNAYREERLEHCATKSQKQSESSKNRNIGIDKKAIERWLQILSPIVRKHKEASTKKQASVIRYKSIEDAIEETGATEAHKYLAEMWDNEWKTEWSDAGKRKMYGMTVEVFTRWKYNQFLNALNRFFARIE